MRKVAIVATASTAISLAQVFSEAWAQQHHHPAPDDAIHEKFYSTWFMPDNPTKSCCNKMDCYPTEIKSRATTFSPGVERTESGS